MDVLQGMFLGIVQGLTEFLPISSTAHLRVVPALLGWEDPGAAYSAVIQLGTLVAVVVYFFRELIQLTVAWARGLWRRRPFEDPQARLAWLLIVGTLPIGISGLLLKNTIQTTLRSLWVVAFALIGLALLLSLAEGVGKRRRSMQQIGWLDGLLIGAAQALALIPGASRSGVTITAGLFADLKRADAARFSFLLSVPAVLASGLYEAYELFAGDLASTIGENGISWTSVLVGTLAAGFSGYLAIAGLLRFLQKHSTGVFIVYRILLGGTILGLVVSGVLVS